MNGPDQKFEGRGTIFASDNSNSGGLVSPSPMYPLRTWGFLERELSEDSRRLLTEWLAGTGEMAERIRNFDWSRTSLGPSEKWSPALRTTVGLMIANGFPLLLWWGPDYISLYNDAYIPVLGLKHPNALGLPVRECWSEIWHLLKPLIDTPFQGGPSTWIEDFELHLRRSGFTEEAHFTVAYSPVPDDTTSVASAACWQRFTRSAKRSSQNAALPSCAIWRLKLWRTPSRTRRGARDRRFPVMARMFHLHFCI